MKWTKLAAMSAAALCIWTGPLAAEDHPLWHIYEDTFKTAKYIDLTHAFEPVQPVWPGFGPAVFKPAVAGQDIEGYIAIAPADWRYGVSVLDAPGAPLPKQEHPLRRDANGVLRPTP